MYRPETNLERLALWFAHTRRGRVVLWVGERALMALAAAATLLAFATVEDSFMPVVSGWRLDYVQRDPGAGHYVVGGVLFKRRSCEHIVTSVVAVMRDRSQASVMVAQVRDDQVVGGSSPVGYGAWGPLVVRVPAEVSAILPRVDHLLVVGTHRCHALWQQETVYGRVPVEVLR